jgi:hypothetical protein
VFCAVRVVRALVRRGEVKLTWSQRVRVRVCVRACACVCRTCPLELKDAVCNIIYCAPYLAMEELTKVGLFLFIYLFN